MKITKDERKKLNMQLLKKAKQGDDKAVDAILKLNYPLVLAIARKKYMPSWYYEFDDIVQMGLIGLCKAIRGFNYDKGQFGPYAATSIKNSIMSYYALQERHRVKAYSLDSNEPQSESEMPALIERVPADRNFEDKVIEAIDGKTSTQKLLKVINSKLTPHQQEIIKARFFDDEENPPSEVARMLGKSKQAVFHSENYAFKKLKKYYFDVQQSE